MHEYRGLGGNLMEGGRSEADDSQIYYRVYFGETFVDVLHDLVESVGEFAGNV